MCTKIYCEIENQYLVIRNRIFFFIFKFYGVSSFFWLIVALRLVRRRRLKRITTPEGRRQLGVITSLGVYDQ